MTLVKFAPQSASAVSFQDARPAYAYGHRTSAGFAGMMAASGSQDGTSGEQATASRSGASHLARQAWMNEVQASKDQEDDARSTGSSRRARQRADKQASVSPRAEAGQAADAAEAGETRRARQSRRAQAAKASPDPAPEPETTAELPVKPNALFASLKAKARQQDLARALSYPQTCRAPEHQAAQSQAAQSRTLQAQAGQPQATAQAPSPQAQAAMAESAPAQAPARQAAAKTQTPAPPRDKSPVPRQAAVDADKAGRMPRATVRQTYSTDLSRIPALPEDKISQAAISQVGARYRYGGESPRQGFDCSGLTSWVYAQAGVDIPRSSREQYVQGQPVDRTKLQSGDLVFFGGRKSISHVGVYIEDGQFVHATSSGKGVRISHLDEGIWEGKFAGARRIVSSALTDASAPSAKIRAVKDPEAARQGPKATELG